MENFINAMLNFILVSIPEEIIWVILTLIFLKRFDLLDIHRWKENIKWIMIPVIPTAMAINIFRYLIPINPLFRFFIYMFVLIVLIIYIVKKTEIIKTNYLVIKTISFVFLGMLVITLSEIIYVPMMLHIIQVPIEFINNNIALNFLLSLPPRVFQIIIICLILYNGNYIRLKVFNNIFQDKILSITSMAFIGLILFIMACVVKFIGDTNMLNDLSLMYKLIISILLIIIPTFLLLSYIVPINLLFQKIVRLQQSYDNMIDDEADVYKDN